MTNFLFLFLIGACSHLMPPAMARDKSKITWINSIATTKELNDYLASSHEMARDVLSLNADNSGVIIGPSSSGKLTLAACLETMKSGRKSSQSLFLDVTTMDIYMKAIDVLKEYANTEKWITLNFVMFRGPNGDEPTFPPGDLTAVRDEWPSINLRMSFSMTTGYKGKEKGYTAEVLQRFFMEWNTGGFNKIPVFGFALDIYHLSFTQPILLDRISDYLRMVKQIQLYTNEQTQDLVDMRIFSRFLDKMDMEQCYFNVPEKFWKRIFENGNGGGAGTSSGVRVCGEMMMVVLGMTLILGMN